MGTSLTEEHVSLIRRYASRAVICYDGDDAGIECSLQELYHCLKEQALKSMLRYFRTVWIRMNM